MQPLGSPPSGWAEETSHTHRCALPGAHCVSWGDCPPLCTGLVAQGACGKVPGLSDLVQPSRVLSLCPARCYKSSSPFPPHSLPTPHPAHLESSKTHPGLQSWEMRLPSEIPTPSPGTKSSLAHSRQKHLQGTSPST